MEFPASRIENFSLFGTSSDGRRFETTNFHIGKCRISSKGGEATQIILRGRCTLGKITCDLIDVPEEFSGAIFYLRGFKTFLNLCLKSKYGTIIMSGDASSSDEDNISGKLRITFPDNDADQVAWLEQVDDLQRHIIDVMSFASDVIIQSPMSFYRLSEKKELWIKSTSRVSGGFLASFHVLDLHGVFRAAITSFDHLRNTRRTYYPALMWHLSSSIFREVQMMASMVALESLIHHNLDSNKKSILKKFDALKRFIAAQIRTYTDSSGTGIDTECTALITEKIIELNKVPTAKQIKLLMQQFEVKLNDISDEDTQRINSARNKIAHRGVYFTNDNAENSDLWEVMLIARELFVRFFLGLIKYEGCYHSYYQGYCTRIFPDCARDF